MMCSRFRVTLDVPRLSAENEGTREADDVADDGWASARGREDTSVSVPRNELSRGFVRILSGISSRMDENVSRWLMRLNAKSQ